MKKYFNKTVIDTLRITVLILCIIAAIEFVDKKQDSRTLSSVIVLLDNQYDNFFVDEQDILRLINASEEQEIMNASLKSIDLRTLEHKVITEKFIKEVEVYRDLKGNVIINAKQRRPIARVLNFSSEDSYIASDGAILPVSQKYTSRVMLIRGNYQNLFLQSNIKDSEYGSKLFAMIEFITADEFWKSQITEIQLLPSGELILYPQVTKQYIEFGKPENVEKKFKKLKIFYKKILPRKGWNSYDRVNLKYKDQIVCE